MDANTALDRLYKVASDSELPALDDLMIRAGFRTEYDDENNTGGDMLDANALDD